ncbi:MAG: SH3 domain-containing protein [Gemmatimonadaceae bacterium]
MKALLAASQCPHCGHLFDIRDTFGELVPLALCTTCDSEYPLKRGECRWCGTKPEGFRWAPYLWKGGGVLAFLGLAGGAWFAHRSTDPEILAVPAEQSDSVTSPLTLGVAPDTVALALSPDTALFDAPTAVVVADTMPIEGAGRLAAGPPSPPAGGSAAGLPSGTVGAADTTLIRVPATVAARADVSSKASAPPKRRARWVAAVAPKWIVVRSSADHKSRVIASIGPNTRVQLGEARGKWVRMRTKGLAGWVERRSFAARGP